MVPQLGNIIFIVLLGKLRFKKIKFLGHGTQINHQTEAKYKLEVYIHYWGSVFSTLLAWRKE